MSFSVSTNVAIVLIWCLLSMDHCEASSEQLQQSQNLQNYEKPETRISPNQIQFLIMLNEMKSSIGKLSNLSAEVELKGKRINYLESQSVLTENRNNELIGSLNSTFLSQISKLLNKFELMEKKSKNQEELILEINATSFGKISNLLYENEVKAQRITSLESKYNESQIDLKVKRNTEMIETLNATHIGQISALSHKIELLENKNQKQDELILKLNDLLTDEIKSQLRSVTGLQGQISALSHKVELLENKNQEQEKLILNINQHSTLIGGIQSKLSSVTVEQESMVENIKKTMDKVELRHPREFGNTFTCCDLRKAGIVETGNYEIRVRNILVKVRCDMDTDGGGWTVIQRRTLDGITVSFTTNWKNYEQGFGIVPLSYWIGLRNIAELTKNHDQGIRFDMESFDVKNRKAYAKYRKFYVSGPEDKYKLSIADYSSGTAGDSMLYAGSEVNGMQFSTPDQDNDNTVWVDCSSTSGWWYNDCDAAKPNGILYSTETDSRRSMYWWTFNSYNSLKFMEMKIRNKDPALCGL